jgi:indole-3-glycerol phosphate synthase
MNLLSKIVKQKRTRLKEAKAVVSLEALQRDALANRGAAEAHAFRDALERDGINVIAEFKRKSPSKGVIRADADLVSTVRSYEAGGAAAISVLTEEDYFDGSLGDLRAANASVALPLLRKDFIVDEYQVYEAAAAGADAVLLIVAVLDDSELESLRRLTEDELGMDALVEVHHEEEMDRAASCGARIIGVNNRDLRTFEVSLETSVTLAVHAPRGALLVSESGLKSAADLRRLHEHGFRAFLLGESLMRATDPAQALRTLLSA